MISYGELDLSPLNNNLGIKRRSAGKARKSYTAPALVSRLKYRRIAAKVKRNEQKRKPRAFKK